MSSSNRCVADPNRHFQNGKIWRKIEIHIIILKYLFLEYFTLCKNRDKLPITQGQKDFSVSDYLYLNGEAKIWQKFFPIL